MKYFYVQEPITQPLTNNAAGQLPKKKRVSFIEDLENSRLPSSVPGIDVCGLTIVIRDAKKLCAPLIDTKSQNFTQI